MRDIMKDIEEIQALIIYRQQFRECLYTLKTGMDSFTEESLSKFFNVSEPEIAMCKSLIYRMYENLTTKE